MQEAATAQRSVRHQSSKFSQSWRDMAKYPWGDDVFPMSVFFPMLFTIPRLVGLGLHATGNDAALAADAAPPLSALKGVALATCAWIAMIYAFFGAQVAMEGKDGRSARRSRSAP